MQLLCCIVKNLFYIPPVLMVWRLTTCQTGAFAIARDIIIFTWSLVVIKHGGSPQEQEPCLGARKLGDVTPHTC
jgi:hypothetical protein